MIVNITILDRSYHIRRQVAVPRPQLGRGPGQSAFGGNVRDLLSQSWDLSSADVLPV